MFSLSNNVEYFLPWFQETLTKGSAQTPIHMNTQKYTEQLLKWRPAAKTGPTVHHLTKLQDFRLLFVIRQYRFHFVGQINVVYLKTREFEGLFTPCRCSVLCKKKKIIVPCLYQQQEHFRQETKSVKSTSAVWKNTMEATDLFTKCCPPCTSLIATDRNPVDCRDQIPFKTIVDFLHILQKYY